MHYCSSPLFPCSPLFRLPKLFSSSSSLKKLAHKRDWSELLFWYVRDKRWNVFSTENPVSNLWWGKKCYKELLFPFIPSCLCTLCFLWMSIECIVGIRMDPTHSLLLHSEKIHSIINMTQLFASIQVFFSCPLLCLYATRK